MKLLFWGKSATDYLKEKKTDNKIVIKKFKLDLPSTFTQKGARQIFKSKTRNTANSLIATIDYFRNLYEHAHDRINVSLLMDTLTLKKSNMRFVVTVPTVWNDAQRSIMRNIAFEAGLISAFDNENKLLVINESLAATLYCEAEIAKHDDLVEGDRYIVCDAGGGTVDISAFIVTRSEASTSGRSRCQISTNSGEKCGSTYIDKAMEELLIDILYRPEIDSYSKEKKYCAYSYVANLMEQFNEEGGSKVLCISSMII